MITVNYLDGVDNIRCDEHLFQWDNGQKLCLSGLNTYVPNLETVDVHFCNKISKLAITVKPTVVSNNIVAPIPNSLLQDPYPIIAYFYVPSDNGSRTIVMVTIPIEPKKRPSDFILNEDEAIASLDAINNKVNTTLNNITVDYNNFKTNIEAELRDIVENLQLEDAKTLNGYDISKIYKRIDDNIADANLAKELGTYGIGNMTINVPDNFGILTVESGNTDNWLKQTFTRLFSPHTQYVRMWNTESWSNWENVSNADTLQSHPASDFALKTELPTSLPANGGNADTVDGKHASDFALKTELPTSLPANGGNADNANTLSGKSIKDLAYITDVICGLKNGWASASAGVVMTYNDRTVSKLTNDLSYIGWFIDSEGWFRPLIVSQYKDGVSYGATLSNDCTYDNSGNNRATFDYKNRNYYACWSSIASYPNPNVTGGFQLTVTNDDYISACKVLIDNCERIEAVFANTASTADVATKVSSPNSKARLYEDGEGGNLSLISPDGNHSMEMDIYNNEDFRLFFSTSGEMSFPLNYNFITKKLNINGDAGTVNGVRLMVGTREPQVEEPNALAYVPENAWYGQYT